MGRIILVTGGSRSGKSDYALKAAEQLEKPRVFIATCPRIDGEMEDRIERHQARRAASEWTTVEETLDLEGALQRDPAAATIIVDCLTLWINNLMYEAELKNAAIDESIIARRAAGVAEAARSVPATVFFVTNEIGLGIIPDNPASRLYRDLVGRCNQTMGGAADEVVLVTCGVPLKIKGDNK